jgi:multidrug efflux pump subunit AcrB
MTTLESWLSKRVLVSALLIGTLAIAAYYLARAKLGQSSESADASYSITIENFGVDSREIERGITIPLENDLGAIAGLRDMRSTSEYGKARVTVTTEAGTDPSAIYLQVRDAADRVYRALPRSAQKPRIGSSGSSRRPVFEASLRAEGLDEDALRELADREIKPSFEKVKGVGEIEIGGGEAKEVHVLVDPAKAAARGLSISAIAEGIQRQDIIGPLGSLRDGSVELPVSLRGRISSLGDLAKLRIATKDGSLRLGDVAELSYGCREPESISRVDGEKMIVLYARSAGSANLVALSRALRAEAASWSRRGIAMDIFLDSGANLELSLLEIVKAMAEGVAAVFLLLPFALPDLRRLGALSLAIALVPLVAAAALSVLGLGIDEYVLSGLAVGLGTIVDNGAIVVGLRDPRSLASLLPSLRSSLVTTLIVLVPLFFLDFVAPGIRRISLSMALLLVVAFVGTVLVLPAYTLHGVAVAKNPRTRRRGGFRLSARGARRMVYAAIRGSAKRPAPFLAGAGIVVAALCGAALSIGSDFSPAIGENTIFARLEFESGTSVEYIDAKTTVFASDARKLAGATMVETIARRGSAELMLKFDPSRRPREALVADLRELGGRVSGGFVYFPEGAGDDRAYEIALLGEDDAVLRKSAREAAGLLGGAAWARQVVLNFKDPPRALVLAIDHGKAASLGVSAAWAASALRWALYGPVALKWVEGDREYDLRVFDLASRTMTREGLLGMPIKAGSDKTLRISGMAKLEELGEGAKIYRKNRQRAVFLTVHAGGASVETTALRIKEVLSKVSLPPGYAFDMDRGVLELKRSFSTLRLVLGLSIFLVFIVLASSMESLTCPLMVLSILPTSLAFPVVAFFLAGRPLRIPALVGLIMLCGMAVNNSILIANEIRARGGTGLVTAEAMPSLVVMAIRKRLKPLLVSSGMTVVGTLPLLFAGDGGVFMRTISFVVFWGILGSLASTFFVLPALAVAFPGAFRAIRFANNERRIP